MEDITYLDYEPMEDMVRVLRQSVEYLETTMQEMQSIANTLADGALLGQAGDAFVDAVRSTLCPAIARLTEKIGEEADDVQKAIDIFRGQQDPAIAKSFD